jgi:hypothetical protein
VRLAGGSNPVLLVIILTVAAVFVIIGVVSAVQMRKQRAALQDWAATRGWTCIPGGGGPWLQYLPQGNAGRGVWHELDGVKDERRVTVADYHYSTASTDSDPQGGSRTTTTSRSLTVVVVGLTSGHPSVELRARVFGKLGIGAAKATGLPPKNLTGVGKFDRRYRIHAHSGAAATLVTPQVIQATLDRGLPAWQVRGDQLIIPWPGGIRADYLDNRIGHAVALAALLDSPDIPA